MFENYDANPQAYTFQPSDTEMCQSMTTSDGFYTGQVQQLADKLGTTPEELVWREGKPESYNGGYKFCLCPIDLEATAEKFGYDCERDDWGDAVFSSRKP